MEKVVNEINELYNVDLLRARVLHNVREYMSDPNNETGDRLTEISQNQFDYILKCAGGQTFGGVVSSDNPLLLCLACVVYVDICAKYNKIVSVDGFGMFTGIDPDDLRTWANDARTAQQKHIYLNNLITDLINLYTFNDFNYHILFDNIISIRGCENWGELLTTARGLVFSRLHKYREHEIKNGFLSSKQQLGAVALVNKEYQWNADNVAQVERARALSLSDLPKLPNYVNQNAKNENENGAK